jgi:hypothetical protein
MTRRRAGGSSQAKVRRPESEFSVFGPESASDESYLHAHFKSCFDSGNDLTRFPVAA